MMKYEYLRALQIALLCSTAIQYKSLLTLLAVTVLCLELINSYLILFIMTMVASSISFVVVWDKWALVPVIINTVLMFLIKDANKIRLRLDKKYALPIFMMCFSVTTMNHFQTFRHLHIILFYLLLGLYYVDYLYVLLMLIKALRWVAAFEIITFAILVYYPQTSINHQCLNNQQWWYVLSFMLSILFSSFLHQIDSQERQKQELAYPNSHSPDLDKSFASDPAKSLISSDSHDIELIQIQKIDEMIHKERQQVQEIQSYDKMSFKMTNSQKPDNYHHCEQKQEQSIPNLQTDNKQSVKLQQSQSQSLNLILLIPFCLFSKSISQIPIYLYLFGLQCNKQNRFLFIGMLLSIGYITAETYYNLEQYKSILLRLLAVLIVSKDIQGTYQFGQLLKIIWLRISFVIVLTILFWFSLLTVNIFHLLFISIILLFITKTSQPNQISYRHQNWIYLVLLFHIFLTLRQTYMIFLSYEYVLPDGFIGSIIELTGVVYVYNDQSSQLFNLTPLLINAIIGFQYMTYNSRIYSLKSKSPFLQNYKVMIAKVINVLTIIYYKLLPWLSYACIIFLLIILDYSVSSMIFLFWILLTITNHILRKNKLQTYKVLYNLWLWYLKLIAFQIILRYIFEFAKFDVIYVLLKNIPFFQILVKYQQLFGLAIRDAQNVYLKTITKFQLMISIDLIAIFVAFLVTQYYSILIKYNQKISEEANMEDKIVEIYTKFIDFKLTQWLQSLKGLRLIKLFSQFYVQFFFPIIGLYSCFNFSILMFFYLIIIINYYLNINLLYYQSHIQSNCNQDVTDLFQQWKIGPIYRKLKLLKSRFQGLGKMIKRQKIKQHDRIRVWMVLLTALSMMTTYYSRIFCTDQINQIMSEDNIIFIKWLLYIGGCSIELGIRAHHSKFILVLIVIEMKCCWFLNKFQAISQCKPMENEENIIEDILEIDHFNENIENHEINENIAQSNQNSHEDLSVENARFQFQNQVEKETKSYREMYVSLLLGITKLIERSFVMVLVFSSIVEGSHPFGLVYLFCALLLNYLGSISIKILSRVLSSLIVLQYLLILSNFTNKEFSHYANIPEQYSRFQQVTILHQLFDLPLEWEKYITFGKQPRQLLILPISFIVVVSYQLYFIWMRKIWLKILQIMQAKIILSKVEKRIYGHFLQVFNYALMYSPLCLIVLCLAIYLMDYTTTNMLLTLLSIIFIFISFLIKNYADSKQFWHVYFIVLQLMIVLFMAIYALLQVPMFSGYCTKIFCSPQEFHSQVYKALLLFILQIGIDIINSGHFQIAMQKIREQNKKSDYFRLAVAYQHNNHKIEQKFKELEKANQLLKNIKQVQQFIDKMKGNPQLQFKNIRQAYDSQDTWIDVLLQSLPNLIDFSLVLTAQQAKNLVEKQNIKWIQFKGFTQDDLPKLSDSYIDEFGQINDYAKLKQQLDQFLNMAKQMDKIDVRHSEKKQQNQESYQSHRKSFVHEQLAGDALEINKMLQQQIRESRLTSNKAEEEKFNVQKKQLLYLMILESILSNWHYLTYLILVLEHIRNLGLLTLPFAAITFCFGLISSYHAGKNVWRCVFLLSLLPLMFKFSIKIGILSLSPNTIYILIGDNLDSILLEYLIIIFVLGECIILKIIGQYHETTQQIECMRIGLIRKIINNPQSEQVRQNLLTLLKQCDRIPMNQTQFIFSRAQSKSGYDYSTLMTSIQLIILSYIFMFYDQMAIRKEITFYEMIEYNQFSGGMVAFTLIQLLFLLAERFIGITDLKELSSKWDLSLILKYVVLIFTLVFVESTVVLFFPINSDKYSHNIYIILFYVFYSLSFLISALQIKNGLDQKSKGFMDRYTWYNGFIYIGFRAVPFLFQFKVFSDWTFTKTSLRIFDWIRLEEIFGRLYVAKCNSLFLQGKQLGSKIEWWKKLVMGYPLLISIILLLFGPLVLFSSLNPLASPNPVTAGYLEFVLKINKTNEYPFYTNSHITDIHFLEPTASEIEVLRSYDIDQTTVQILHLEEFSDQYWEISEGSYYKLLAEPQSSLYQLTIRAKLDRNQTGMTNLYVLNTYEIPKKRVKQFKQTLLGNSTFSIDNWLHIFMRIDNNNGLHFVGEERTSVYFHAQQGQKANKQYWIIEGGLKLKISSDKYTKAISGYSVMSFYISIILVIANYFRFLFQGSVHTIIMADIPHADPLLALCDGIYYARKNLDIATEQKLFWLLIDLVRSPDNIKALTGNYLQARLETLRKVKEKEE